MTGPLRVLFVSTGNSARSQIAEALLRWLAKDRAVVISAGTAPSLQVHPLAHEAVRRVINRTLGSQAPKSVADIASERFDYVFTLHDDVQEISACFPDARSEHWPHDDPGKVTGSLDARRRAFDRFAAALLKRLRRWWKANAPKPPVEKARPGRERLPRRTAEWRTRPPADSPTVVVVYLGPQRRCVNMCAHLERSGFQVLCGDKYARSPDRLKMLPDAIVVRADGPSVAGVIREEFVALRALQERLRHAPTVVLLDHAANAQELELVSSVRATTIRWTNNESLVRTLDHVIGQPRS